MDFWEGVTKPGSTTATDTTSEHQVQSVIDISLNVCLSLPQDGTNSVLFSQAGEDVYDNQLTDNEVTEDGNVLNWNLKHFSLLILFKYIFLLVKIHLVFFFFTPHSFWR